MASAACVAWLYESALLCGAAVLPVLLMRTPLRRYCGAQAAYLCWWLPVAVVLARLLPAAPVPALHVRADWHAALLPAGVPATAGLAWHDAILAAWLAGAVLYAASLLRAHAQFLRGLGPLTRRRGLHRAQASVAGAMLVGLLRPRIIVGGDFEAQYAPHERRCCSPTSACTCATATRSRTRCWRCCNACSGSSRCCTWPRAASGRTRSWPAMRPSCGASPAAAAPTAI